MKSEVRKEYDKARKNLQAQVRRMKKAGYIFEEEQVPSIPKRVTKGSTRRLKEIQSKLYERSVFQAKEVYEGIGENIVVYPGRMAKARRRWKKTKEETQKEVFIESDIFVEVHEKPEPVNSLPDMRWNNDMRMLLIDWPRKEDTEFLYINKDYGVISAVVETYRVYIHGIDGLDHTLYQYFQLMTPNFLQDYIFDPEQTGEVIMYDRSEWEAYERGL